MILKLPGDERSPSVMNAKALGSAFHELISLLDESQLATMKLPDKDQELRQKKSPLLLGR